MRNKALVITGFFILMIFAAPSEAPSAVDGIQKVVSPPFDVRFNMGTVYPVCTAPAPTGRCAFHARPVPCPWGQEQMISQCPNGPALYTCEASKNCRDTVKDIGRYAEDGGLLQIAGAGNGTSGAAYNPDDGFFYVVDRSVPLIFKVDLESMTAVGTYAFTLPFRDLAGLGYAGGKYGPNSFVAVERKSGANNIVIFRLPAAGNVIAVTDIFATATLEGDLEGVHYNAYTDELEMCKERFPSRIMGMKFSGGQPVTRLIYDTQAAGIADCGGVTRNPATGNLVVVSKGVDIPSAFTQTLVEIDKDGKVLAAKTVPHRLPRGISFAPDGTLYVVGEPGEVGVYK